MSNVISQGINKTQEFFGKLSQKEIFDIADKSVSVSVDNKQRNRSRWVGLHPKHCSWYMGKIFQNEKIRVDKVYNDHYIIFSLGYLFKHIPQGEKVVLKNGTLVSAIANGPADVKDCMSVKEANQHILSLATKYFPERVQDLAIVEMDQEPGNLRLFQGLKQKGLESLETESQPVVPDDFDSQDIAKYLYRVCQHNKAFFNRMKKLIPEEKVKKTLDNFPEYYGFIEIACRLNDLLNGINRQGGADMQNRYDDVIRTIVGTRGNLSRYPELKDLQQFCKQHMQDQQFGRLYLQKKAYKEALSERELQLQSKLRMGKIIGGVSLALLLVLAGAGIGYQYSKTQQAREKKEKEKNILKPELQDKIPLLQSGTDHVYSAFIDMYGGGEMSEPDLKALIKNELSKGDNLAKALDTTNPRKGWSDFIREELIPNNKIIFINAGCDLLPYQEYQENKEHFQNTLNFKGNLEIKRRMNAMTSGTTNCRIVSRDREEIFSQNTLPSNYEVNIKNIGDYHFSDGTVGALALLKIYERIEAGDFKRTQPPRAIQLIVGTKSYNRVDCMYDVETGREIINDISLLRKQSEDALNKPK